MRILLLLIALAVLAGCSGPGPRYQRYVDPYTPTPGSTILRVEVLDVKYTNYAPSCARKAEDSCTSLTPWVKYRARVKGVFAGVWTEPEVEFAFVQSADFLPFVTRDCYVVLRPAGNEVRDKLGVSWRAERLLSHVWDEDRPIIKKLKMQAWR